MRRFYPIFVVAALTLGFASGAWAQAYTGTTGTDSTGGTTTTIAPVAPPAAAPMAADASAPPTLPPVFQGTTPPASATAPAAPMVPTAPQAPATGTAAAPGQLDANALPPDPCAAYLGSYDVYAICQDRIKRLQRMQELKEKRLADAAARKQAAEDKRKAAAEAREAARNKGFQRPGEVPVTPKPTQVQIVPADPAAAGTTPVTPATPAPAP